MYLNGHTHVYRWFYQLWVIVVTKATTWKPSRGRNCSPKQTWKSWAPRHIHSKLSGNICNDTYEEAKRNFPFASHVMYILISGRDPSYTWNTTRLYHLWNFRRRSLNMVIFNNEVPQGVWPLLMNKFEWPWGKATASQNVSNMWNVYVRRRTTPDEARPENVTIKNTNTQTKWYTTNTCIYFRHI